MGYHKKDWIEKALVVKPAFCMTILTIDMLTIFIVKFESELDAETFCTNS